MAFEQDPTHDRGHPLLVFLHVLGVALARKEISGPQAGIALLVALSSTGTSGRDAVVDADDLARNSRLSGRQVWRHFGKLVESGWFLQTVKPSRPTRDQQGRRARYRLTLPSVDLSDVTFTERLTWLNVDVSHDVGAASDTPALQRLTLPSRSCDTAESEDGTLLPSVGSPSLGLPRTTDDDRVHDSADTDREPAAPEGPPEHQEEVAWLVAKHQVSPQEAADCVAWSAKRATISLRGFMAKFDVVEVREHAAQYRAELQKVTKAQQKAAQVSAARCPVPGHRGPRGVDPEGDPRCEQCATERIDPRAWEAS